MLEIHPFEPFVPEGSRSLLLGSFPGRQSTQPFSATNREDDWYYGSARNQFWLILSIIFERPLGTRKEKQDLMRELKMAVCDLILSCERSRNLNTDQNLIRRSYNLEAVTTILAKEPIERILFTGSGVRTLFIRHFTWPQRISLIDLPSPSPLYAKMSLCQKTASYRSWFRP